MIGRLYWIHTRIGIAIVLAFVIFSIVVDEGPDAFEPDEIVRWITMIGFTIGFYAGLLTGGIGLRQIWIPREHPSNHYTLCLPLSRRSIVAVRLAWTTAIAAIALATVLTAHLVVSFPEALGALTASQLRSAILLSVLHMLTATMAAAAAATFLGVLGFAIAGPVLLVLLMLIARLLGNTADTGDLPSIGFLTMAAIAILCTWIAVRFAPRQEY